MRYIVLFHRKDILVSSVMGKCPDVETGRLKIEEALKDEFPVTDLDYSFSIFFDGTVVYSGSGIIHGRREL